MVSALLLISVNVMKDGQENNAIEVCMQTFTREAYENVLYQFIAICTSPCIQGTCTSPDTCECNDGWTGAVCDTGK